MGSTRRRWNIELKVLTTTVTAAAAGGAAAILNDVQTDSSLLGGTPPWLQALVLVVAPTAATALTGWATKHTTRPDLDVPRS
jgi:hypothetical protein